MTDDLAYYRRELERAVSRIPPAVVNGSWNNAVSFKRAVLQGRKVLEGKRRATLEQVRSALNALNAFDEAPAATVHASPWPFEARA